jgi:hypothetical protein
MMKLLRMKSSYKASLRRIAVRTLCRATPVETFSQVLIWVIPGWIAPQRAYNGRSRATGFFLAQLGGLGDLARKV